MPGSSFFGEPSFSMLGRTCTYQVEGLTFIEGPPIERLLLLLVLVAWPLLAVLAWRGRQANKVSLGATRPVSAP